MSIHTPTPWPKSEAAAVFDPSSDVSLMLAMFRVDATRDEALRLADENCRKAGHEPLQEPTK